MAADDNPLVQEQSSTAGQTRRDNVGRDAPAANNATDDAPHAAKAAKSGIMAKLGLDIATLMTMFKGAIAPTIGLAIYQSSLVAHEFTTVGYLVGIISVLSLSILPRGKFVQTLILNILFLCIGAAVGLLILWSSLQARLHTETVPARYNSSQAAVSGVWLFANIWIVNTLRAKFPSLNVPGIVYSIMTNITCTFSPLMTTTAGAESLILRLFTTILTGFAVATASSLLVLPLASRDVTKGQMKGLLMLLRGAVAQEKIYLQSLEREDMFAVPADISAATHISQSEDSGDDGEKKKAQKKQNKDKKQPEPVSAAEAKVIKDTMFSIRALIGKIYVDLPFAKRDISWDKLSAKDLSQTFELLRGVIIPINGISTVIDIFQRVAEKRGWVTTSETPLEVLAEKIEDKRVWNEVMKQLHEPFEQLSTAIDEGLLHAGMMLELLPRPKSKKKKKEGNKQGSISADAPATSDPDVEAQGDLVSPGDTGFYKVLRNKIESFQNVRSTLLRTWAIQKGLLTDDCSLDEVNNIPFPQSDPKHHNEQSQLFLLLYLETLMEAAGEAVLRLVEFSHAKVADGTMAHKRLIYPRPKALRKWIASVFGDEDKQQENNADLFDSGIAIVYMGDSFAIKKDPEHLPPTTVWQRLGNGLRVVSKFFGSEESTFGFRCACATLTVGIVAFLESSYVFFQEQRLVWAMIIIAIGMTQTAGQSIWGFFLRISGTLAAAIFSLIIWYIVDGKTAGVLVFLYLFQALSLYFLLKFPNLIPGIMICMVTQVLIIGYELQVLKIGIAASEATGQVYYPIYELAFYRLATVAGGCLVAFFWTVFPSPLTERTWLRRDLSATLYLLANYFSVINETLKSKLQRTGGDRNMKGTPAYQLSKQRRRLFGKLMLLLPSLKQHADFQKWEPTIGGKYPRELYEDIILRASRINSYLTLLSYTVCGGNTGSPALTLIDNINNLDPDDVKSSAADGRYQKASHNRAWLDALNILMADISPTQHIVIGTLTLLSNSLASGHSLPPHLQLPRPYELTRQLEAIDAAAAEQQRADSHHTEDNDGNVTSSSSNSMKKPPGLLDARNMTQAGYAEFAVLQVCSALVCDDIEGLVKTISNLVGVVDFSFRLETTSTTSSSNMVSIEGEGGKGKVD
ncbi:hypothetical protein F5Y16DRAFT_405853 [Xylariaceae sp. FL0255]|nr:hypothetical protein F5Y16DRAFT_405853 [Xylariaceae sp. FL0255]